MQPASFITSSVPLLTKPERGATILEFRPVLVVENASELQPGISFWYTFEVYGDDSLTTPIIRENVAPTGTGVTSVALKQPLPYGETYWWRVRVNITANEGLWTESSYFSIYDPENDAIRLTQEFVDEIESGSLAMSGWSRNSQYYEMEKSDLEYGYAMNSSTSIDYTITGFNQANDLLAENIDSTFTVVRKSDSSIISTPGLWVLSFIIEDDQWKIYSSFFYPGSSGSMTTFGSFIR